MEGNDGRKACRTCHWSEHRHPFGLWCLLFNWQAKRACDAYSYEPGTVE